MSQKDKEIYELEKEVKLYKEKLDYLKKNKNIYNLNNSLNSFNLSKTRSSTNVKERNLYNVQFIPNNQVKIKTSGSLTNNLFINKNEEKKLKNDTKKRPKSNNYHKPKIDFYNFKNNNMKNKIKRDNNFKKNNNSKNLNEYNNNNLFNCKRAKSSKVETKKSHNNILSKLNKNVLNIKENKLLTLEETQYLCDKMIQKMKLTFELVKAATLGDQI